MNITDLILLVVLVASAVGLLAVLGRKFPLVSQINPGTLPGERDERVKQAIIEQRLKRKLQAGLRAFSHWLVPQWAKVKTRGRGLIDRLTEMERSYRRDLIAKRGATKAEVAPKISALAEEAEALIAAEQYAEAEKKGIEMVALDPKSTVAYRLLGDVYLATKEYPQAREVYQFLLKLNQEDADALAHLGTVEVSEGNLSAAKADVERAVSINQQVSGTHLQLCEIYQQLGQLPEAVKECQSAARLEPNSPKVLSALLEVAILAKDKTTAWSALDQLKSANPENQKLDELAGKVEAIE